jgi:fumarate reductase flavoprotein subunit
MSSFEFSVPVVVVGGGACGAVAALAAREAGLDILLLEQDAAPHGTTSMSQGLICGAGTQAQKALGIDDDAERFYADIMAKTEGLTDPLLARTIAEQSGPCLDWLISRHDLPWELDVRFKAAYGHTRARVHGWMGRSGIDMVQLLHARLAAQGVDVLTEARLVDIIADNTGRVLGIELERPDASRERIGCGQLILAAGGFAANAAMVQRYMPEAASARCNGHEGNRGDAIVLGAKLGAALADMGAYQGYGMLTDPQGITVPPGIVVEGGLMVNALGQRFINEVHDISGMVHPVLAQPDGMAWVIYDAGIEERCGYIPETQQLIAIKAPRAGDTVAALAQAIRVDADALAAALAAAHEASKDASKDSVGRNWRDAQPPVPPYRAVKVCGAIYHTQGGLQIDAQARVLRADGSPFPNLYAGGGSARCVSGPSSWGYLPAMGLCSAVTFGRLAGQAAASAAGGTAGGTFR